MDIMNLKNRLPAVDGMEQIYAVLELPNAQFDAIYPDLKNKIVEALNSNTTKRAILDQLELTPINDIKKEKESLMEAINEIDTIDELSINKKDFLKTMLKETMNIVSILVVNPRETIKVKIQKINENAVLPTYAHDTDAGADIYAIEDVVLKPHSTNIVKTGLKVAIPAGYEIQIRPRSGLSLKTTLRIANAPGTIDSEYRGEVGVIIENTGNLSVTISKGDKIAQMLIAPTPMIEWEEVDELDETSRGEGGYGSTDKS